MADAVELIRLPVPPFRRIGLLIQRVLRLETPRERDARVGHIGRVVARLEHDKRRWFVQGGDVNERREQSVARPARNPDQLIAVRRVLAQAQDLAKIH